jgi:two-component system NtrC family response regulator
VGISCGAIPENLLESELFGHEKGAFTDAHVTRAGRLEVADGGTVFLDEIGELPPGLQSKLLRFIQEREIERVGGRRVIPLDVRVIAATHRRLAEEIRAGRFREDLYYRLSVVNVEVPPLRDRGEDVLLLAEHFLARFRKELGRERLRLSPAAAEAIRSYAWPGNVRELEHRIQSAAVLADGDVVRSRDFGWPGERPRAMKDVRNQAEREAVQDALRRTAGNISRAAADLGISRPTMHDLLRRFGIDAAAFRDAAHGS